MVKIILRESRKKAFLEISWVELIGNLCSASKHQTTPVIFLLLVGSATTLRHVSVTAHALQPVLKVIHLSLHPSFAVREGVTEPVVALRRLWLAPGKDDLRRVAYLHVAAGAHMEGSQRVHKELCEQQVSTLDYSVDLKRKTVRFFNLDHSFWSFLFRGTTIYEIGLLLG